MNRRLCARERDYLLNGRTGLSILGLFFGLSVTAMSFLEWGLLDSGLSTWRCVSELHSGRGAVLAVLRFTRRSTLSAVSLLGLVWGPLLAATKRLPATNE